MEPELLDDNSTMQELFQHNLLLELDPDLKNAEAKFLNEGLRPPKLSHGGTFTDLAISPVLLLNSEYDLANRSKLLHLERDKRELDVLWRWRSKPLSGRISRWRR